MESINSFRSLKQDLNKLIPNEDGCLNVLNFRPITDEGGTTGGMVNIRGNDYALSIPCTSDVWLFSPSEVNLDLFGDVDVEIDIENYTNFVLNIGVVSTIENLCKALTDAINADLSLQALGFHAYYFQNNVYFINTLGVYTFNVNSVSYNGTLVPIEEAYLASQCNLKLIGWTKLRDDIYIFTTNSTDENPGGVDDTLTADTQSAGQIWKLSYDEQVPLSGTSPSLTLIYNNILNFTNVHPIPELGGAVSIYENDYIGRIYWTDNFNVVRSLNVYNPNAFATPVNNLGLRADIDFSIPELHDILSSGQCKVGIYQLAYRYYNQSGSKTSFFLPSKPIHIVTGSETGTMADYSDYEGTSISSTSDKSIVWKVDNPDQNFEYVEFAILYRSVFTSIPEAYITGVRPINNIPTIYYTYTGQDPDRDVTISLEEFIQRTYSFDIAKSITHKNNFLFAANTKSRTFDLDYDAKTFRFSNFMGLNYTYIQDLSGNFYTTVPSIPDNQDIVNPYNQLITSTPSWYNTPVSYKYQYSGPTLGGEGNNIKYKFITKQNLVDDNLFRQAADIPWRQPESNNPSWGDYKSPFNVQYKGYKRNEVYRFGILFYDKSGNPGFVKWIDDIRMPGVFDNDTGNGNLSTTATFPLLTEEVVGGITTIKANQLGLEFEVNIPAAISKKISGFSIVRVKREDNDRTILATGCLDTARRDVINGNYEINAITGNGVFGTNYSNATESTTNVAFFYSPETLFKQSPTVLEDDCLIPLVALNKYDIKNVGGGAYPDLWKAKYYNQTNVIPNITDNELLTYDQTYLPLLNGKTFGVASNSLTADGSLSSGEIIWNKRSSGGNLRSVGNKVEVYKIDNSVLDAPTVQTGSLRPNSDIYAKWLMDYYRANSNQYGGTGYYEKSLNQYISTGHFQKVEESDSDQVFTCEVFGGDTVVTVFDYIRSFGYYNTGTQIDVEDWGWVYYFPIESYINTDLRSGYYHNNDGQTGSTSTTISDYRVPSYREDFIYNMRYSNEDDVLTFFQKPYNSYANKIYELHDNRIWSSQPKIHGENTDSWSIFKSADYIDVDGVYGPINNLIRFRDRLVYFQDDAVGVLSSNERIVINDAQNQSVGLALGTSSVLQRYDYVSTNVGCKHQFGMCTTDTGIYWFDIKNLKHYKYSDSIMPISDIGMSSFFAHNVNRNIRTVDNPYLRMGITATYDYRYNDVIFTFLDYYTPDDLIRVDKSFTIAYNELTQSYSSFYSFTPSVYINDRRNIFTPDSSNVGLYLHNIGEYCKFYGQTYPSKITVLLNPYATETKIWNNLELSTEAVNNYVDAYDTNYPYIAYQEENLTAPDIVDNTFDTIRFYNDYQNTDYQLSTSIAKRKERTWNIQIPRNRVIYNTPNDNIFTQSNLTAGNKPFGERLRSKYLIVDFIYNNNYNYKFTVNTLKTLFEKSFR